MSGVIWNSLVLLHFSLWWTPSAFWTYQKDNLKTWKLAFFFASVVRHSPVFIKCVKLSFLASIASNYFLDTFSWDSVEVFLFIFRRYTNEWLSYELLIVYDAVRKSVATSLCIWWRKSSIMACVLSYYTWIYRSLNEWSAASCYIPISHFYFS